MSINEKLEICLGVILRLLKSLVILKITLLSIIQNQQNVWFYTFDCYFRTTKVSLGISAILKIGSKPSSVVERKSKKVEALSVLG